MGTRSLPNNVWWPLFSVKTQQQKSIKRSYDSHSSSALRRKRSALRMHLRRYFSTPLTLNFIFLLVQVYSFVIEKT